MPSVSFFSPARCVLMVGDEALYMYDCTGGKARLIDTVPWGAKDFEGTVSGLIQSECKGKPLLIVNDMTDQHFKGGQRIPKVSPLDKSNVVQRKLTVSFPNYPIRGALAIKDKIGKAAALKANASGGLYLFAAVPMSEPVSKTLAAAKRSLASIAGFTLLPIESSDMVKTLADKAMKREKTKSRWAVLIGQHMGGGLRQVIIRDGQLAMTRMTPVTDLKADPDAWVNEVAQEFKATISYLSRFGYSPDDGTEVFVISTPSAGQKLQDMIDVSCNFTTYTVTEAAEVLGFRIGAQEDQYHADPLHAAWLGRKTRFILPMDALDIKKIYGPRQAAMLAGFLLFCGASYLSWQTMNEAQALFLAKDDLTNQKRIQQEVEARYNEEAERMKALGFDINLIRASLDSFRGLEEDSVHPLPLIQGIGNALGSELRIDKLVVKRIDPVPMNPPQYDPQTGLEMKNPPTLEAIMTLSFPPTLEPEEGVREVNGLVARLNGELAGYTIAVAKQVADLSYTENTEGEVGALGEKEKTDDYKAEISIKGPLR